MNPVIITDRNGRVCFLKREVRVFLVSCPFWEVGSLWASVLPKGEGLGYLGSQVLSGDRVSGR